MSSTNNIGSCFAVRWSLCVIVIVATIFASVACSHPDEATIPPRDEAGPAPTPPVKLTLDHAAEERILALSCEHITDAEVTNVLALAPAPRIINLQGLALVTMTPFSEFLIAMGYPEERIRNPRDGSLSYDSNVADGAKLAGSLAWYYEHESMMPMLIGHSQGGMVVVKVLHELDGDFGHTIVVWNPVRDETENRSWIVDPNSGMRRPVLGLKVPYAAAIATGSLMRVLLFQWEMLPRLHQIPDTVVEFTAYQLKWDPIAGNFGRAEPYQAMGSAKVRNVVLPSTADHMRLPFTKELALDPATRAWINNYSPLQPPPPPPGTRTDVSNLLHAADIWYSVKKYWCIEAQRPILAQRAKTTTN